MRYIRKVHLDGRGESNEHITQVQYSATPTGDLTRQPRDEVVRQIRLGGETYWSHNDATGDKAKVEVRSPVGRDRYIATVADGRETNNLLSLPRY